MDHITLPNRANIEGLFPTTASYALDERGRREVRTCAEFMRLAESLGDTAEGCRNNPYHVNALALELVDQVAADKAHLTVSLMHDVSARRLAQANDADFDFFLRSVSFMGLMHVVGIKTTDKVAGIAAVYDVGANWSVGTAIVHIIGYMCVFRAVARRLPVVRFDPRDYVVFMVHWDDLDAQGVPRVSIDGYKNV